MSVITMTDVAKRAGVSAATVSRYLSGQRVREAAKVAKAIADLNFTPSAAARSLKSGQTKTLALVVPDISNPYFSAVARGVEQEASASGFTIELHNAGESGVQEAEILRRIQGRVDGLIIAPVSEDDQGPEQMARAGLPVVFIDREVRSSHSFSSVLINNIDGAAQATRHLIEHGHELIAVIHGPIGSTPGRERLDGFKTAMSAAGLSVPKAFIVDGRFTQDGGQEAMRVLLSGKQKPTAVFVCNNMMTIGALLQLKSHGIDIPTQMSVVGFDDLELAPLLNPPLTVISRPTVEQGKIAAQLLINHLNGRQKKRSQRVVMDVRLLERGSCAQPPQTGSGSRPPGPTSSRRSKRKSR